MPTNFESRQLNTGSTEQSAEQREKEREQLNRKTGAKLLSLANFQDSHRFAVESSFDEARTRGEKLPGKNNERRNYAHLAKLEEAIEKYGNAFEKMLWQADSNDLTVKYENIPESYWDSTRQELRDNGAGNVELTEELKHQYHEKLCELQEESLEKWVNYLGDENAPYPLWFKVYAWDGMTKMGVYNKAKGKYETRNESTVAPYPEPDAEILGKMLELINRYHGNNEREFFNENGERNVNLEKLVQSGNFAKIYTAIQRETAPIINPPERAEDIYGKWIEYKPGDEDYVAVAAKGTGWCVASSATAKHYLEYGKYGDADDYDDYEDYEDENNSYVAQSNARFYLFHLEDPDSGRISRNAVASIRLNRDGEVAEISGLEDGQALNDSLVQTVEDKVKTLPGGEEFLPKFADKNELIRLDRKMQNGEDLTKEELEFIYEVHRPINMLDTYNNEDPRIEELRESYDIFYALDHGASMDVVDEIISNMHRSDIVRNLDELIEHGMNADYLVSEMHHRDIADNLDKLIEHGANIDNLVSRMSPVNITYNLDKLIEYGANIDIDNLVSKIDDYYIVNNLDKLIEHGANIDNIASNVGNYGAIENLDKLIEYGANIDNIVPNMFATDIIKDLDKLIERGANIDNIVSRMDVRKSPRT